jgi:parallel beta-helix repeat protein
MKRWGIRIGGGLVLLLITLFLIAAFWPVPPDLPPGGLSDGMPGATGALRRPFPPMPIPPDNPQTPEKAELGRLLFYDPILSGDRTRSCATCHHPDLGFTDGKGRSIGADGQPMRRGAPTLWNVGYLRRLFWDGRATSLEEAARMSLTDPREMAADPERLVRALKAIPEYRERFDRAFGGRDGSAVTFENIAKAIAAFERTLVSRNSPFDRFAAGDAAALTPAQRRGLNLFRSGRTRCFECHTLPLFGSSDFRVIGVPDLPGGPADRGRAEVTGSPRDERAFKVPTLRNVALTAPYMHNGIFATLEEVVDFYKDGGGRGRGMDLPNLDSKIQPFRLSPEEREDLVAFLYALTDESAMPPVPESVPSGLPVVPRLENPARAVAARYNVGAAAASEPPRAPQTRVVRPGESIQAALDQAGPGDTILVEPGIYRESLVVEVENLTLRGIVRDGQRPILDGEGIRGDGIIATRDGFTVENFIVRHYTNNGIVVPGARGIVIRDVVTEDTGAYGVYPVGSEDILIERVVATGAWDTGIYIGQSRNGVIRDSEAYGNVSGIEVENSVNITVVNNYAHDNAAGLLVFVLPNLESKVGSRNRIIGNRIIRNNGPNFAKPGAIVGNVPSGTGILIMAADETEVTGNEIRDNASVGIAVVGLHQVFPKGTVFDVGAIPERNWIHDNVLVHNGFNPDPKVRAAGLPGADLLWDASGWDNLWREAGARAFPPFLPGPDWPWPVRRAYWRLLQLLVQLLG